MVTEAEDVPAHDLGQLLHGVNLVLRHLEQEAGCECSWTEPLAAPVPPPVPVTGGSPAAPAPGATA